MRIFSRNNGRFGWTVLALAFVLAGHLVDTRTAQAEDAETDVRAEDSRRPPSAARWQHATREERREWREAARQRWEDATPRERRIFVRGMRGLATALPEFSLIERRLLFRTMVGMSKSDRAALRKRLRRIDELEPEGRSRFVAELRSLMEESPEQAARIDRNIERWRSMPESDREKYREQMRRFREMSSEERQKLLEEWDEQSTKDTKR